jgi:hypothetical protein
MRSKVFISAPISVDWSTVACFESEIRKNSIDTRVSYWDRNSRYDQNDLDSADAVVFILPKNQFAVISNQLPVGLKSELSRAYALGKSIYVGYTTGGGKHNIYNAATDGWNIQGIAGTVNNIYTILNQEFPPSKTTASIQGLNPCEEIELPKAQRVYATTIPNPDYVDQRILLMM